jgi:hypothetical protein
MILRQSRQKRFYVLIVDIADGNNTGTLVLEERVTYDRAAPAHPDNPDADAIVGSQDASIR